MSFCVDAYPRKSEEGVWLGGRGSVAFMGFGAED